MGMKDQLWQQARKLSSPRRRHFALSLGASALTLVGAFGSRGGIEGTGESVREAAPSVTEMGAGDGEAPAPLLPRSEDPSAQPQGAWRQRGGST